MSRRTIPSARTAVLTLSLALALACAMPAAWATCGGGGGGGMGGANPGGGGGAAQVYHVPWKVVGPGAALPEGAILVYWFPTSPEDARASADLLTSRYLTVSSEQCVPMVLVTNNNSALRTKFSVPAAEPIAVLSGSDGSEIGRVPSKSGKIAIADVEDLLRAEIEKREEAAKQELESAKAKAKEDAEAAAALYTHVWEQRCLLPSQAKKAAKGLKKLGKPVAESESSRLDGDGPILTEPTASMIVRTMESGLTAERAGRYAEAKRLYASACAMDPADPVPARYLGELMRHHTGEWKEASAVFEKVLAMRADALSRAVALHGLGKMTIHAGDFAKGLALFEESLASYPLALTYRNLAVYWNSEGQNEKAYGYVKQAMALDPDDPYNSIFAATYLVALGRPDEAVEIARRHEGLIDASYNLAGIYAQLGNKQKTLEMLRRHFYEYERYEAVRVKEMQEARDDAVFARYHADPDFVKLTALAEEDAMSFRRGKKS